MLDNGYLFAKDESRLFINTCLECLKECSYGYLPKMSYSTISMHDIIEKILRKWN